MYQILSVTHIYITAWCSNSLLWAYRVENTPCDSYRFIHPKALEDPIADPYCKILWVLLVMFFPEPRAAVLVLGFLCVFGNVSGSIWKMAKPKSIRNSLRRSCFCLFQGYSYTYTVYPIPSMYGIFTHIWPIFVVNVGKYAIHGCYGYVLYIHVGETCHIHPEFSSSTGCN